MGVFTLGARACERSWAVRISAPRSRGCSLPRSTAQSRTRSLCSIPLPAHLQFHPAPEKSLHARSNLKLLCMPKTCRFHRSLTPPTHCLRGRRGAGLLAWLLRKNPLHFYSVVEPQLRRGWTTPDTRVFRRQCGCSNLLTWVRKGKSHAANTLRDASATQPISYKELTATATSVKIEHIYHHIPDHVTLSSIFWQDCAPVAYDLSVWVWNI